MSASRAFFNRNITLVGGLLLILSGVAIVGLGISVYRVYVRARSSAHLRSSIPRLCEEAVRQRQVLDSAIESYKRSLGCYPPDHVLPQAPPGVDAITNQLLYELLGTTYDPVKDTFYPIGFPKIKGADAKRFFNTTHFKNSTEDRQTVGHFLNESDTGGTIDIQERPDTVALLTFWPSWQGVDPELYQQIEIGTWCYNSSAPTHKPNAYDLWIEIKTPLTNIVIANW